MLVACVLVACGGGGSGDGGNVPLPGPEGRVVHDTIASGKVGASYAITVYLPASYEAGTRTYPVIYAVEGDAKHGYEPVRTDTRFEAFKRVMQRRGTQAILVGIGGTHRRDFDFLLPLAANYHAFLVEELVPQVERQYRADPERRALSGLSHGGHFVNVAQFLEGAADRMTFSHFLSTETSSGGVPPETFLAREQALHALGRPLPTTVFLAAGATGTTNEALVSALYWQMLDHDYEGLALLRASYPTTHVGADLPAFEEALERFFP